MSYIRCLSNPEGLYVTGGREGVCWSAGVVDGEQVSHTMPANVFTGLMKAWAMSGQQDDEPVEYKGAKLEAITKGKKSERWKWCLSYKRWSLVMYTVTLAYIASNVITNFDSFKEWVSLSLRVEIDQGKNVKRNRRLLGVIRRVKTMTTLKRHLGPKLTELYVNEFMELHPQ